VTVLFMSRETTLPWGLILALGLSGLVRPVLSILGVYDALGSAGRPWGPLTVTGVVSVAWIVVVVARRVSRPLLTLTLAGVTYAVLALLLNLSLQPFLESAEAIPPAGVVAMVVTNGLQGAVLGLIATALLRVRQSSR
jgi:hypothetical protein